MNDSRNSDLIGFFDAPGVKVNYIKQLTDTAYISDEVSALIRRYSRAQYKGVDDIIKLLEATEEFLIATDPSADANRRQNKFFMQNLDAIITALVNVISSAAANPEIDTDVLTYCQNATSKRLTDLKEAHAKMSEPLQKTYSLYPVCKEKLAGVDFIQPKTNSPR